jgi:hypothetical protein
MVDNDDKIKEQLKQQIKPVIDNMVSALSERKPKDTVHPYTYTYNYNCNRFHL